MRTPTYLFLAGVASAVSVFLVEGYGPQTPSTPDQSTAANSLSGITVDYPAEGSIFPPDLTAPTFLWRDGVGSANRWAIDIGFADGGPDIRVTARGELMRVGPVDDSYGGFVPPKLTPEQAAAHTWKPDAATWAAMKTRSSRHAAKVVITGFGAQNPAQPVSRGQVTIETSTDPVGAPIFYRDVPLVDSNGQGEKGIIKPLPDSLLPLIKWRLRYFDQPQSTVMMQDLPTCANCHSFSRDGKTLGLDVDGPNNNKGLYALLPLERVSSISTRYVIKWSEFTENTPQRFGFMSQVSPNGKYVVTSVEVPGSGSRHLGDRLYQGFYPSYGFVQVFYPTRGVLAWYSRESGKLQPLPGADDPEYVQACAFWSPDGRYLVFSRAKALDPYPPGQPKSRYANDPNETQIQYDLYRIPFNDGKGGTPERIAGASENGMSNNFPKISPDGKWIVFVQNKTGLLMRPDSHLYIVPAEGGVARRLNSNQKIMNSWHSFSPNGRWLVFSSKGRSLYTQLYLTHIDENGNDSPAILIDDTTAANRAANIPEFLNISKGGLERIDAPATEFYRLFNVALEMMKNNRFGEAIPAWRKALALDSDDDRAHFNLGFSLSETGDLRGAIAEYRRSSDLNPKQAVTFANLALAQAQTGDLNGAVDNYRKAAALDSTNSPLQADLGAALFENGQHAEGIEHLETAVALAPESAEAHNKLGFILAKEGRAEEARVHLEKAVGLKPDSAEYRFNLGYVLTRGGNAAAAIPHLQKAVQLTGGKDWECLAALGSAYNRAGRESEAIEATRRALNLAVQAHNQEVARGLRATLERYQHGSENRPSH
ncbi:MAG: tetratricopeptide repeat protein [Bryobacteraceae bacterium]